MYQKYLYYVIAVIISFISRSRYNYTIIKYLLLIGNNNIL